MRLEYRPCSRFYRLLARHSVSENSSEGERPAGDQGDLQTDSDNIYKQSRKIAFFSTKTPLIAA